LICEGSAVRMQSIALIQAPCYFPLAELSEAELGEERMERVVALVACFT
jgi:hypothetical protein